jgi:hypothetical protein
MSYVSTVQTYLTIPAKTKPYLPIFGVDFRAILFCSNAIVTCHETAAQCISIVPVAWALTISRLCRSARASVVFVLRPDGGGGGAGAALTPISFIDVASAEHR